MSGAVEMKLGQLENCAAMPASSMIHAERSGCLGIASTGLSRSSQKRWPTLFTRIAPDLNSAFEGWRLVVTNIIRNGRRINGGNKRIPARMASATGFQGGNSSMMVLRGGAMKRISGPRITSPLTMLPRLDHQ